MIAAGVVGGFVLGVIATVWYLRGLLEEAREHLEAIERFRVRIGA